MPKEDTVEKQDDSMEEILTSIKDIISGEEEPPKEAEKKAEVKEEPKETKEAADGKADMAEEKAPENVDEKAEAPAEEEVLELTDKVEEPEDVNEDAADDSGDVLNDIDAALGEEKPKEEAPKEEEAAEAAPSEPDPTPQEAPAAKESTLVSAESATKASQSLKGLVDKIPTNTTESPVMRSGNTVEDLVIESLKPMLAEWLDKNLPSIVERIVEKEVRRLIPDE